MAGGSGGAGSSSGTEKKEEHKYKNAKDAKELLDKIGEDVYDKVKEEAKNYIEELKGSLLQVSTSQETVATHKPCDFEYTEHTTSAKSNTKPCGNDGNNVDRFSVKEQAEYDNKKIKCSNGSNGKNEGACASFRRLHLCNKNIVKMVTNNNDGKAKNDLLAEVCYAAKYEGESIKTHYPKYDEQYPGSGSGFTLCTMLARSFADIGDIIRGKDLFLGHKQKKNQLEERLKTMFENIKENNEELNSLENEQVREYWWTANRETIWEAITCGTHGGDAYFHATCNDTGRGPSQTQNQCRCDKEKGGKADQVPTYFDYVPQFLRWFEEWAEDFCRKKKKYVGIVKKYCRGNYQGDPRYCSRNGYDCEKTISRIGKVRMGKGCTDCFFACNPYEKWIDNQRKQFLKQKEEFDKQKNKYDEEITRGVGSGGMAKRAAGKSNYDGYESKFYKKLKDDGNYSDVNKFLEKLSEEKACKEVQDPQGGKINFKEVNSGSASVPGGVPSDTSGTNNKNEGTFYRSEYCQPCPDCGVKKRSDGKTWEEKDKRKEKCDGQILYTPKNPEQGTHINFLYSGEGEREIKEKLEQFCTKTQNGGGSSGDCGGNNIDSSLCEPWKCYQSDQLDKVGEGEDDVESGGGLCILQKTNGGKKVNKQKTFHDFFYYWVAHMLKDSIYWETQKLDKCINNTNKSKACKNNEKCKTDCGCFERWIGQKKEQEWTKIKEHFGKQEGLDSEGGISSHPSLNLHMTPDFVLEGVLKLEFSKENIEEDKKNNVSAREIDLINEMLEKEKSQVVGADSKKKNTIDLLIEHEENDATKCKQIQEDCENRKKQQLEEQRSPGRSNTASDAEVAEEEEEEEGDDNGDDHTQETEETQKEEMAPTTQDTVDVCKTVAELFKNPDPLKQACSTKYGSKSH
ncbi:hypothetical protein PFMC_06082, partial [Plasmodium falciparum CAMP/Malaysia]